MQRLEAPVLPDWLAKLVPFERYQVQVNGARLHVMETGRGTPVVMLHGNPTWGFLYRKVAAALSGEPIRIILPDLYGLGLSDKPTDDREHTLEHHAQLIGALLDALELDRLVFVGQDWGGPIGLRALADRRERVAGLVILNTAVSPPREDFRPTLFHRLAHSAVGPVLFRGLGFPLHTLWMAQGDKRSISGEVARAYRWPLRENNRAPLALARMVPDSLSHPSIPALRRVQELVESFRGPAAIVWGDRDPILGRVRTWVEKLLPQATVTRTQAGHFLQEEVPNEIAEAVRRVVKGG